MNAFDKLLTIAKGGVGLLVGIGFLAEVSRHAGSGQNLTIVHVTENRVDLLIDGIACHVESATDSPLVYDLGPGRHELRLERGGELLYEEIFEVRVGEDLVLTAWNERNARGTPLDGSATTTRPLTPRSPIDAGVDSDWTE